MRKARNIRKHQKNREGRRILFTFSLWMFTIGLFLNTGFAAADNPEIDREGDNYRTDFQFIIKGDRMKADSLAEILRSTKNIKKQIEINNLLGAYYESTSDYPLAISYLSLANDLNKNNNYINDKIFTWNYIGYVYWHQSRYDSSLYYHNLAFDLEKNKKLQNSNVAFTCLMLGSDYYDLGDYIKTSEFFFESLKLYEKLKDTTGQIQAHNRLSKLYYKLKDFKSSENHILIARNLNQNVQYHRETAVTFNNIGNIKIETGFLDSALYYFTKTLQHFAKCGDVIGQSIACINLGDTYSSLYKSDSSERSLLDSAYFYYQRSYSLNKMVDNKFGMIYGLWGMADVELKKGNINNAVLNYRNALQQSKLINAKSEEYNLYWKMHNVFEILNNNDSSYYYLKNYVRVKNSLENEEQTKALLRQESKYETEKRIREQTAEMDKEKLIAAEKNKWKNYIIIAVILIASGLTYMVFTSVKRLKIIASKNEIIKRINSELILQKKEITDSINYAGRIQEAILPSANFFEECHVNCFVLYKPKDIVAGDFYWLERKDDIVFVAAADCTGHGVPGAMVSVVCSNALNRTVLEFGITETGKILDKTRELVLDTFSKSDKDVKDGMDISLIAINQKTQEVFWSGANNPLCYIASGRLHEIKADKHPIGKSDSPVSFKTHSLPVKKGDMLYLFSDGYADQFGGEKGKKFKYKPLKELLLKNHSLELAQQQKILDQNFEKWRGNLEQVDDVCMIGIRV
jgi:serine phosphatase RsbU (regulator of sigma subunit)/tetratricopeptide (TPR) repeat protein